MWGAPDFLSRLNKTIVLFYGIVSGCKIKLFLLQNTNGDSTYDRRIPTARSYRRHHAQ